MKSMQPFVTGSRVYGTPRKDSDIDLVVLVDEATLKLLENVSEHTPTRHPNEEYQIGVLGLNASLRFGRLNLLCVTTPEAYEVWKYGTEKLKKEAPVTRDRAVEVFSKLRKREGLV